MDFWIILKQIQKWKYTGYVIDMRTDVETVTGTDIIWNFGAWYLFQSQVLCDSLDQLFFKSSMNIVILICVNRRYQKWYWNRFLIKSNVNFIYVDLLQQIIEQLNVEYNFLRKNL